MTDDTTTWLKKNPATNPLRRSLKTSLRFHVNATEMDASIMSNPGKAQEQQIIIPRMLQRPSIRMLKANEFKVPGKFGIKTQSNEPTRSGDRKDTKFAIPRKSFLPVKNKTSSCEKKSVTSSGMKVPISLLPGSSARKNTFRRDLIQKMVEIAKNSNQNGANQLASTGGESGVEGSVIRSILKKKRSSLRKSVRTSTGTSHRKSPRPVKKVLFEGFETSLENDKENESILYPIASQLDSDFPPLDEPTVFLNFPKSNHLESSPLERGAVAEPKNANSPEGDESPEKESESSDILKCWNVYVENLNNLQSLRNTLADSFRIHIERSRMLSDQFTSYLENCEELYGELSRLGKEVEANLGKVLSSEVKRSPRGRINSAEKRAPEKEDKIRLSIKSKVIKKSSAKGKTNAWHSSSISSSQTSEGGFTVVEKKGVLNK